MPATHTGTVRCLLSIILFNNHCKTLGLIFTLFFSSIFFLCMDLFFKNYFTFILVEFLKGVVRNAAIFYLTSA